jgi:hypothetical protein
MNKDELLNALKAFQRRLNETYTLAEAEMIAMREQAEIDHESERQVEAGREERKRNYPRCHCGQPVAWGFDGNQDHTRGMCKHCDEVRCDAYPGACDGDWRGK